MPAEPAEPAEPATPTVTLVVPELPDLKVEDLTDKKLDTVDLTDKAVGVNTTGKTVEVDGTAFQMAVETEFENQGTIWTAELT